MAVFTEYLAKLKTFEQISAERKIQLKRISELRGGRDILVYAADITARGNVPNSIEYADILPFKDQLNNLRGSAVDLILETPGGLAEIVEDLVYMIRKKYNDVGVIIPGTAKSAGTIWAMAANEILMGDSSSLGPIDAQILANGKRFSADAFLDGLEKIKQEVLNTKKLNPAYIPILQNISPGEIQSCENAQKFSKVLVTKWLSQYKFQNWEVHSSTGKPVTKEEKVKRAEEIAEQLCKHSDWLTHNRSIKIEDLKRMRLVVEDYTKNDKLNDAITRYYTLLRMGFESSNMYKMFETTESQVMRFAGYNVPPPQNRGIDRDFVLINYKCSKCQSKFQIQANFKPGIPKKNERSIMFPKNNIFVCPVCKIKNDLSPIRINIEAELGKKIIL